MKKNTSLHMWIFTRAFWTKKRKHNILPTLFSILLISFFISACGEDTEVGAGLLEGESIGVDFTRDFNITARTIKVDSVQTYLLNNPSITPSLIGNISDPIFGKAKASLVCQGHFDVDSPDYRGSQNLDSLVLVLILNDSEFYGDTTQRVNLDVHRITNPDLSSRVAAYSNERTEFDMETIGSIRDFRLNFDSTNVYDPILDSIVTTAGQIRIPLDLEYANGFTSRQATNNDTTFVGIYNGYYIEALEDDNYMFAVDMSRNQLQSRLTAYYTVDDSTYLYNYPLGGVHYTEYEQDYSGTSLEQVLDNEEVGQQELYLQNMSGAHVELEISGLEQLNDVLLNKAELELVIDERNEDNLDFYPPIENLLILGPDADGEPTVIPDAAVALSFTTTAALSSIFGGNVVLENVDGLVQRKYLMNVTQYLRDVLESGQDTMRLEMFGFQENSKPNRTILYGPGSTQFPLSLKVTYTDPQ